MARPSPSRPCGLRRISARARCPVMMAQMLPRNGISVQPRMPATRLTIAMALVCRTTTFIMNSLKRRAAEGWRCTIIPEPSGKGVPFAAKRRCGAGFAGGTGSNRRSCGQGMVGHAGRDASCSSLAFGGADRAPCGSAGSSRAGAMWRLRCATGANAPPRADVAYLHRAGLLSVACSRRVFTGCHCHCCRCRCRESENRRVACVGYATTAVAAGPLRPRSAPSMCPARHATSIKDRT